MLIEGQGHWGGDANRFCEQLLITATSAREAEKLAALKRTLDDPDRRAELLDMVRQLEEVSLTA